MKLHQLRDVIAVAETGSLRAAARQLNIAQSAITKSVQLLEKELDVPLFERHKRGVILTPIGHRFVQRARSASAELTRAQDEIVQLRGAGRGSVTVSLSTVPHMALLPSVIQPFRNRYPEVRLSILEALGFHSIEEQMRGGAVDAYIGIAPIMKTSTEYQVETLFKSQRCVVARVGHPLANARSLGDLVHADWLVSSNTSAERSFKPTFGSHGFAVPKHITLAGSILSQLVLLLNSDMLLIAPRLILDVPPYQGKLVALPIAEAIESPTMVMVRRASSPLTPAAEHFSDLIRRASVQVARESEGNDRQARTERTSTRTTNARRIRA